MDGFGLASLSSVDGSAGSSLGGTDGDTSEAAVVAKEGFADDPRIMNVSPQGAEYDGELPLRVEDWGWCPCRPSAARSSRPWAAQIGTLRGLQS